MTRRGYRNVMLLVLVVQLVLAAWIFGSAQTLETRILAQQGLLTQLEQERANTARLSAATAELDQLTINETNLTFVDVLRHLDLADSKFTVSINAVEDRAIGGGVLKVRTLTINGTQPYPAAMNFMDNLHNSRKLVIREFRLQQAQVEAQSTTNNPTGLVDFTLVGVMYGLAKTQNTANQP
jgi:hypothetical protein